MPLARREFLRRGNLRWAASAALVALRARSLRPASASARLAFAAGFFRTVFYLPDVTPPVAIGILILVLCNGSVGVVNRALEFIGIPGPFWTTDPNWIKPSLAIMSVWTVGGTMVIYLAALKAVEASGGHGGH